jgi:hypothetical protein
MSTDLPHSTTQTPYTRIMSTDLPHSTHKHHIKDPTTVRSKVDQQKASNNKIRMVDFTLVLHTANKTRS